MAAALLVEDHADVRKVLKIVLESLGYQVRAEADGHAGIAALDDAGIELLVTDLRLPGPSGIDIARAALDARPQLPVLIVSGNVGIDDERAIDELGVRLLRKPFTSTQLAAAVDACRAPSSVR